MTAAPENFQAEFDELCSAEDFLDWFGIDYQKNIVEINRLHILQRFHNYLAENLAATTLGGDQSFEHYKTCLEKAYQDFAGSSAQQQKVLKVFKKPQPGFVSLEDFE